MLNERDDMLNTLADYDTDRADLDSLKEVYWNDSYKYYDELDDEELEKHFNELEK